jgi:hypothetical protein
VLSHAYVPGIHVLRPCNSKDVDGRDEPGHDESKDTAVRKDGVLSHAYVPGIHVLRPCNSKDVDGRDKPGHDESKDTAVRKDGVHGTPMRAGMTKLPANVLENCGTPLIPEF